MLFSDYVLWSCLFLNLQSSLAWRSCLFKHDCSNDACLLGFFIAYVCYAMLFLALGDAYFNCGNISEALEI